MSPAVIGSMAQHSPVWLAERAIDVIAERSKSAKGRFAVSIDVAGRVLVSKTAAPRWLVATATRKSCPDWLEDELRHEWGSRNA